MADSCENRLLDLSLKPSDIKNLLFSIVLEDVFRRIFGASLGLVKIIKAANLVSVLKSDLLRLTEQNNILNIKVISYINSYSRLFLMISLPLSLIQDLIKLMSKWFKSLRYI